MRPSNCNDVVQLIVQFLNKLKIFNISIILASTFVGFFERILTFKTPYFLITFFYEIKNRQV